MAPAPEKEFTEAEVAAHNKVDDCWLIIGNENTGELPTVYVHNISMNETVENALGRFRHCVMLILSRFCAH